MRVKFDYVWKFESVTKDVDVLAFSPASSAPLVATHRELVTAIVLVDTEHSVDMIWSMTFFACLA